MLNNKCSKSGGAVSSLEALTGPDKWDFIVKYRLSGAMKGKDDGWAVWLSKTSYGQDIVSRNMAKMPKNFGFFPKFTGIYVLMKHDHSAKTTDIYFDRVKDQAATLANLTGPLPQRVKCKVEWDTEESEAKTNPGLKDLSIILKFDNGDLT